MNERLLRQLFLILTLAAFGLSGCSSTSNIPPAPEPLEPNAPEPLATPVADQQEGAGSGQGGGGGEGQQGEEPGNGTAGSSGGQETSDNQGGAEGGGVAESSTSPAGARPPGGPSTTGERTSAADERLQEALGKFDQLILAEQQEASREASETPSRGGGSGENDRDGSESSTGDQGESGSDSEGSAGGNGIPEGDNSERVPGDVGDGSGDDIVARQLREAAINEEDPELRERLWEEYRAYKRSVEGGG